MPELPEVETIRTQLEQTLPLKIRGVSFSPYISSILKEKQFSPQKQTIRRISRKGKLLNFILGRQKHILSHLGMSGSWRISAEKIDVPHTHLQFTCTHNKRPFYLAYIDPRRFGKMYFLDSTSAEKRLARLGVDVSTSLFTTKYLSEIFQKFPSKTVKPFLLEQKYFSGVGNYMASEILARAGILPTRQLDQISKKEVAKIKKACDQVITGSLKYKGLSFHGGYLDAKGEKGKALSNLVVFNQKICGLCQRESITKITQKGRGTYYCPSCQK